MCLSQRWGKRTYYCDFSYFVAFSIGDRSCAGKSMAYLEMRLTISKTFWYFDFEREPGEAGELGGGWPGSTDSRERRDEFQLYDSIAVDHTGPNVVFLPRGRFYEELGSEAEQSI
ncbi:cytochrome P450 [Diaporthe eres]|nr:cytochrome P450 [Diaporthe eres]